MSPLHKTCRSGEAGKYTEKTECLGELRDKRGLMKLKCKEFAFVYKKYGDQNSNRQIVKKGGSEHTESYLKRITSTVCGRYPPGGMGGGGKDGFLDVYMRAKEACNHATQAYKFQYKKCSRIIKEYKKTGVKTVEFKSYHQVGIVDGGEKTTTVNPVKINEENAAVTIQR